MSEPKRCSTHEHEVGGEEMMRVRSLNARGQSGDIHMLKVALPS